MMMDQVMMVDWTELNSDLVKLIAKKLGDMGDLVHFRAVCKPWRSAACIVHVPQFPWLLVHHPETDIETDTDTDLKSKVEFHSLSSGKTYTSPCPEPHCYKTISPPSDGYVRRYAFHINDDGEHGFMYWILNPLTWDEVLLPLKVGRSSCPVFAFIGCNHIKTNHLAIWCYTVCERANEESEYGNCYYRHNYLSIWIHENKTWTTHRVPWSASKIAYWRDNLLVLGGRNSKNIMVIEKTTGTVLSEIPLPAKDIKYMISVGDENLLAIKQNFNLDASVNLEEFQFEVFRLGEYKENPHWTKLSYVGDLVLFVDAYNSFALKASDFDGFGGNCIYFITHVRSKSMKKIGLGRHDMRTKKTERVPWPAGFNIHARNVSWFVPTL